MEQQRSAIESLQHERNTAIATIDKHRLTKEYQSACEVGGVRGHVTDSRDHVIHQLKQQNDELHSVIHEMRREIEQLTDWSDEGGKLTNQSAEGNGQVLTVGYVKYMESEVVRLKTENRKLKERIQELPVTQKPPTPPPSSDKKSPTPPPNGDKLSRRENQHRSHLIALSDTIASLQQEKAALELQVLKLRSEVQHWEKTATAHQEQVSGD